MTAKMSAAGETLENLGWTYDGTDWAPPLDTRDLIVLGDIMAGHLEGALAHALNRGPDDAGALVRVNELGPLLHAWTRARGWHEEPERINALLAAARDRRRLYRGF